MLTSMGLLSFCRRWIFTPPISDLHTLRTRAEDGDPDAQFSLGLKYGSPLGEAQDFPQAAEWYRRAADQNHALAQFNLAVMLTRGQGVKRDDAAALTWFRKAAESGDGGAQHMLGSRFHRSSLHDQAVDAAESRIEAYKWLQLSATQGYHGSDAARERVTLQMTRDEIEEGNQRVSAFVPAAASATPTQAVQPTEAVDHSAPEKPVS